MSSDDVIYKTPNDFDLTSYMDNISEELKQGLNVFKDKDDKKIVVFGSARIEKNDPVYNKAYELGKKLAENGYAVMTGGGPGIMEAALKGAKANNGNTYGINVILPHEQGNNDYVTNGYTCKHLFTRKIFLTRDVEGYVFFNGGFGTLDELFEILTIIATNIQYDIPVILIGKEFWGGLIDWLKLQPLSKNYIQKDELDIINIVDNVDDAIKIIKNKTLIKI